jgi:hypothetical protein
LLCVAAEVNAGRQFAPDMGDTIGRGTGPLPWRQNRGVRAVVKSLLPKYFAAVAAALAD